MKWKFLIIPLWTIFTYWAYKKALVLEEYNTNVLSSHSTLVFQRACNKEQN